MATELLFRDDAYLRRASARGAGRVRLLRIPGIDLQPCGGTHGVDIVENGGIRVLNIRSEGKRNKRVEIALAG